MKITTKAGERVKARLYCSNCGAETEREGTRAEIESFGKTCDCKGTFEVTGIEEI